MLVKVRNEVVPVPGSNVAETPSNVPADAPLAAFDAMSYDQIDGKPTPPKAAQPPK